MNKIKNINAEVSIDLPGEPNPIVADLVTDNGKVSITFDDPHGRMLEVLLGGNLYGIEVHYNEEQAGLQPCATEYEVDRHAEKQGVSHSDAYSYFEDMGYNMSDVVDY